AAEEGAVDLIAQIAVRLSVARKGGHVESGFELIDEAPIHAGQLLEAAHAEIGQVRRNIRHPAEIAGRSTDATRRPGAAAVYVVEAAEKSGDGLGCAVERHVDIAVAGDFAAWRLKRQRVSRLVPEEPLVLLAPFHWEVGNLGLCLCRRCRSLRC